MKIAVFGSGAYYQKYKHYLCKCDIQYIIDNFYYYHTLYLKAIRLVNEYFTKFTFSDKFKLFNGNISRFTFDLKHPSSFIVECRIRISHFFPAHYNAAKLRLKPVSIGSRIVCQ